MPQHEPISPSDHLDGLKEIVTVAREASAAEVLVAERLENKARQQVLIAAQWFAIVQAVLAVALNNASAREGVMAWVAGGMALLGGLALSTTVYLAWSVWRLRSLQALSPQGLMEMQAAAHDPSRSLYDDLILHYAASLQERRRLNQRRADQGRLSEYAWFAAMTLPFAELICALVAILVA